MDPELVIPQRTSRRSFAQRPLLNEHLEKLQKWIQNPISGPLGTSVQFQLVSKEDPNSTKLKLGTYGFIQGARNFIVGQVEPSKVSMLDYGFLLEILILRLTDLGLGTCWLGGTFDRSEFGKAVQLKENWVIPAITPLGYPNKNRSLSESLIRAGAGSKRRKNWDELFFDGPTKSPILADHLGRKAQWLELLRIAPSASNNQPWRILVQDSGWQLYLNRKPGYQKTFGRVDIQMIDMGIAMSHLQLMAEKDGFEVSWNQEQNTEELFDWEYVISFNFKS